MYFENSENDVKILSDRETNIGSWTRYERMFSIDFNNDYTVHAPSKPKIPNLSDTLRETYNLLSDGYDINRIAAERGFTASTILDHVFKISKTENVKCFLQIKPDETIVNRVKNAKKMTGSQDKSKPIYEYLGERISYEDIKLALLFID